MWKIQLYDTWNWFSEVETEYRLDETIVLLTVVCAVRKYY